MAPDLFAQLITLFFAGLGLLLVGGLNVLLRRRSAAARVALSVLVGGVALAGAWAVSGETRVLRPAGLILLAGTAAVVLAQSGRLASALTTVTALVRRPAVGWGVLGLAGCATMIGALARHDLQAEDSIDRQMREIELATARPPATTPIETLARTDRGSPVSLKEPIECRAGAELGEMEQEIFKSVMLRESAIRRSAADDRTNCHGWVFAGGQFWVTGDVVDQILSENGYQPVTTPQPGDVVVYRTTRTVVHTALVRYVSDGQPVMVEGKWGCMGVFLHSVERSPYGDSFAYYRSPRPGHLLAGLGGPVSPAQPEQTRAVIPDPDNPNEFTE